MVVKSNSSPEFQSFAKLVDAVIAVPHSEIKRREAEYQKKVAANPRKRGPKKTIKPSASPVPDA